MSCHHLENGGGGSTLSSSMPSCKWAQFLHQVGLGPSTVSELCWANSMLAIANSLNSLSSTSRKTTWLVIGEFYVYPTISHNHKLVKSNRKFSKFSHKRGSQPRNGGRVNLVFLRCSLYSQRSYHHSRVIFCVWDSKGSPHDFKKWGCLLPPMYLSSHCARGQPVENWHSCFSRKQDSQDSCWFWYGHVEVMTFRKGKGVGGSVSNYTHES